MLHVDEVKDDDDVDDSYKIFICCVQCLTDCSVSLHILLKLYIPTVVKKYSPAVEVF